MDCVDLVQAYVLGELASDEIAAIATHLATCAACKGLVAALSAHPNDRRRCGAARELHDPRDGGRACANRGRWRRSAVQRLLVVASGC